MKKQFLKVATFVAVLCVSVSVYSQDESKKSADYYLKKTAACKISSTSDGALISFDFNIKSPRDATSGMASGKRQHKPMFIVNSLDNSIIEAENPGVLSQARMSTGKASMSDISYTMSCSKKSKVSAVDNEFTIPTDCPDGDHDLIVSWSWGASNSGSSKRCHVPFKVTIKDGIVLSLSQSYLNKKLN